ncbi:MAG: excinuclease ABC subunit UvrA [Candidatus Saccharibacteria bacterium]|nr:excinuclease ABC subunit UvrA [Candidatus Saccharibacteria bacterium]
MPLSDYIVIKGAREHNLKNINLEIPRHQLVVITGVSGSGKSSLAFDTIFAEGQRRYLESLSSYARQFLGMKEKPEVEQITGLSPVISIDQKTASRNPRSTVATVTEIYDYLRLLYARIGVAHDPSGQIIQTMSYEDIVKGVLNLPKDHRYLILASIVDAKKGQHAHIPDIYQKQGYSRVRVNGTTYDLDEFPELDKNKKHNIEIVIDRIINNDEFAERIGQSIEAGLSVTDSRILVVDVDEDKTYRFSQRYYNSDFPDFEPPEMEPRTFSFNSPFGACPVCMGLGRRLEVDPQLVIPNGNLSITEGAIRPYNRFRPEAWTFKKLAAVADRFNFSIRVPTGDLTEENLDKVFYGTDHEEYQIPLTTGRVFTTTFEGVIPQLERLHKETDSSYRRAEIERYMVEKPCHQCKGQRLNPAVLAVTIADKSIAQITGLTVTEAQKFFNGLKLSSQDLKIGQSILREIKARLGFLEEVGLDYLTLDRAANTLSGGEAQRIRLATQIGSGLQGVLYILDEPSIGLHQFDHQRLLSTLKKLRDLGNSLLIVEHDEDTIRQADFVVDVGPQAGLQGGQIVASGTPDQIYSHPKSLTGQYLRGEKSISFPNHRRPIDNRKYIEIKGANQHNLKNIDIQIPLGVLVAISGMSGSGKSTLINGILASELKARLNKVFNIAVGAHQSLTGSEHLDKVIIINQDPIGRTPRSNPATYVGLYTPIRELFAKTPLARQRGYTPGRFSFNVSGGRCETCAGDGALKKEMHFLPDIFITCQACQGKRYTKEVLEVHYKGKNIADILNMTVNVALEFFTNIPSIYNKLTTLHQVGLGYIALGQSATTLSGGEAQRIKLAKELSKRATGKTLYILDEPTTGLHMDDIKKLLEVLHALVDAGNSMIIIEHNLDVLKNADWIIDMGPRGGDGGGEIVITGTPEKVAQTKQSYTGQFLKRLF